MSNDTIRIALVDDHLLFRSGLRGLLAMRDDFEVVGDYGSGEEFLAQLPLLDVDIVFMDIHIADGESFRIFDSVDITAPIIFTTAYDQYALEAFKVNSIDYLLKPIAPNDLHRAMDKLHRLSAPERSSLIERTNAMAHTEQQQARENIFLVQVRDRIRPLNAEEVAFFYTSEDRVTLTTLDDRRYPVDKTLEMLSQQMPSDKFYRANRQFIVSRNAVKDIAVWFGSRLALNLTIETPERIIISKARVPEFKAWLSFA